MSHSGIDGPGGIAEGRARVAVENVTRLARSMGYLVAEAPEGPDFRLTLTRE